MMSLPKPLLFSMLLVCTAGIGSCKPPESERLETSKEFPKPVRAVSQAGDTEFSNEAARDEAGEAEYVMDWAGIQPGTTVADIGAGEGY